MFIIESVFKTNHLPREYIMKQSKKKFCAYYRVSTSKQNTEMPAQVSAVKHYLKDLYPPEKSFTEVGSGGKTENRPELKKALEYCKQNDAILIVSKLDRLSRSMSDIARMLDGDIDFVFCDLPGASRLNLHILGAVGDWERRMIGTRTKEALAEKKKQGVKLGRSNPKVNRGFKKWQKKQALKRMKKEKLEKQKREERLELKKHGLAVNRVSARENADQSIIPTLKTLRGQNFSYEKIAKALNQSGIKTRLGSKWSQTQVIRVAHRNNI